MLPNQLAAGILYKKEAIVKSKKSEIYGNRKWRKRKKMEGKDEAKVMSIIPPVVRQEDEKTKRYRENLHDLFLFSMDRAAVLMGGKPDVNLEIIDTIRDLRQFIEHLRRLLDGDEAPAMFLKREDVARLGRDELAFIVENFWNWYSENGCPRDSCEDYFCHHCQCMKEEADEDLANGELAPEDYNIMAGKHFYDEMCDDMQEGCWADYFLWCYRNGYEPATGKKKEANNG